MIFSPGLIRALIGGIVGAAIGMLITMAVRGAMGLPAWGESPATFVGTFTGLFGFLIGAGVFADWLHWVGGGSGPEEASAGRRIAGWAYYMSYSTNHKVIGIQYMVTCLVFMFFAGPLAMLERIELSAPGPTITDAATFNSLISVHGITMITIILLGISGMMNYLIPLMIGARDMAFPRLNALSYWLTIPAGLLLVFSLFIGGHDTGWTAYPPLSAKAAIGMQFMLLGFYIAGFSSIVGGVNIITTILKMRAPGMSFFRMPVFIWSSLATAFLAMCFTQFVGMSFLMVTMERLFGLNFFVPDRGGNVLLYQHLFWFYSHPAVYVFVLPGLGVISEIVPVFARKPLFGYRGVAVSSPGIAIGGSFVWGHHMFAAGIDPNLRLAFMFTTLLVAIPTGVKVFAWLSTIWMGKLRLATPFLFVVTSIIVFVIGGLTGVVQGIVPNDLHITDTYWVVSHFHHTLFGGFVFPMMAAIYFWFPKVTGRMLGEGLGKVHWAVMSLGFLLLYEPMFYVGLMGMRRRIFDFDPSKGYQEWNVVSMVGSFLVALSLIVFVINIIISLRSRERATANPWRSRTLEWQVSSPPPEENFEVFPQVLDHPYGYGVPSSVHSVFPEPHAKAAT